MSETIIRKCDRCDAVLPDPFFKIVYYKSDGSDWQDRPRGDLCEGCYKGVYSWMNEIRDEHRRQQRAQADDR